MSIQTKVNVASAIGLAGVMAITPFLVADRVANDSNTEYKVVQVYTNYSLPPCDEEDGTATTNGSPVQACFWDATKGNGKGTSFIVISR